MNRIFTGFVLLNVFCGFLVAQPLGRGPVLRTRHEPYAVQVLPEVEPARENPWVFFRFPPNLQQRLPVRPGVYQVFLGQIPNFWTEAQIEWFFYQVLGVAVRVHSLGHMHAFLTLESLEEHDIILQWHHHLLSARDGIWMYDAREYIHLDNRIKDERYADGLPGPIVIEPRHRRN